MKKQDVKKNLLRAVKKVAGVEVEIDVYSWPPQCTAIFHQPKRPKR